MGLRVWGQGLTILHHEKDFCLRKIRVYSASQITKITFMDKVNNFVLIEKKKGLEVNRLVIIHHQKGQ